MVTVFLSKALICFSSVCYPALVGDETKVGTYDLIPRMVLAEGYGGNVIQYSQNERVVLAIHRVWEGNPSERRRERLLSDDASDRIGVTNGCINVSEEVYDLIYDCCSNGKLIIKE